MTVLPKSMFSVVSLPEPGPSSSFRTTIWPTKVSPGVPARSRVPRTKSVETRAMSSRSPVVRAESKTIEMVAVRFGSLFLTVTFTSPKRGMPSKKVGLSLVTFGGITSAPARPERDEGQPREPSRRGERTA